jgi:hypothetical protein
MEQRTMTSAEILARRRQDIIAMIAIERSSLALQGQAWGAEFNKISVLGQMLNRLRKNPLLISALVLGLILIKPHRISGAIKQTSAIWQQIRVLLPLISLFLRSSKVK